MAGIFPDYGCIRRGRVRHQGDDDPVIDRFVREAQLAARSK
jgi:hypothetical protein